MQDKEPVYELIRKNCTDRPWTSREFAEVFRNIKFTNRCREMQKNGEVFNTVTVTINGWNYKGYQYIGKKAA